MSMSTETAPYVLTGHDEPEEAVVGTQIKFALQTIRGRKRDADEHVFGHQLRFAYRTIRNAIERRHTPPTY